MHPTQDTPVFRQIAEALKARIASGEIPPHGALPSERAVAQSDNVSRMTARRALEAVEAEGLAYSKGRQGRFVSPGRITYDVASMADFVTGAAERGLSIDVALLSSHLITACSAQAQTLCIDPKTPLLENTRLFRHEGHAVFLETESVVLERFDQHMLQSKTLSADDNQPIRYSPLGATADITIRMRAFTDAQAALLDTNPNHMGIEQEQIVRTRAGVPFCLCHQIWRGELAEFSARALLNEDP